jgi:glycosyltransferase involved in cell wall biosynthesis
MADLSAAMNLFDSAAASGLTPFSIIIPTLNEEKHIGTCLGRLAAMKYPSSCVEVIVVDNGSTDATLDIAISFATVLNLRVLQKQHVHVSSMRNFAAENATGEVLAFLDADCYVPTDWLLQAHIVMGGGRQIIAGARYQIPMSSSWVAEAWYAGRETKKRTPTSYVPSGDLFVAKSVFRSLGGFDESLETNEDYELCHRAAAVGIGTLSVPELAVIHEGTPQSLRSFFRKQRWHGKHVLRVFLRNMKEAPNVKAVTFAVAFFACCLCAAVGAGFGLARGNWSMALFSVLALLCTVMLLAMRDAAAKRQWRALPRIALLYFVFGLARAMCIASPRNWRA